MTKLSKVMKKAWSIKKENKDNIFALCLKMAWEIIKKGEKEMFTSELGKNKLRNTLTIFNENKKIVAWYNLETKETEYNKSFECNKEDLADYINGMYKETKKATIENSDRVTNNQVSYIYSLIRRGMEFEAKAFGYLKGIEKQSYEELTKKRSK